MFQDFISGFLQLSVLSLTPSELFLVHLMVRVFANGPGDLGSIPGWVKPKTEKKKWYLTPPCLTLSIIRYGSKVWSNPEKGVASSSTPWCSSYWKRSLQVTFDYGHQLYLLTYYCQWLLNKPMYLYFLKLTDHLTMLFYWHIVTKDIYISKF